TNVSERSQDWLMEAAIETTDPVVVQECRDFIQQLRGDPISALYAKKLMKLWKPPKSTGGTGILVPRFRSLWLVPLVRAEWDELAELQDRKVEPVAKKKLGNRKRFVLEKFLWEGDDHFTQNLKIGHHVIQAMKGAKDHRLYPPSR